MPPKPLAESEFAELSSKIVGLACALVLLHVALVIAGWVMRDSWLIHFPIAERYGTTMPLTALGLLAVTAALWLNRTEDSARRTERRIALGLAGFCVLLGILVGIEYTLGTDLGIDLLLFPESVTSLVSQMPGRPALISAFCFFLLGSALLLLDVKHKVAQRALEIALLLVLMVSLERCVSFLYREIGGRGPRWRMFGRPVFQPMTPTTALAFITLSFGILYARLHRRKGWVGLFYTQGLHQIMARWMVPVAIATPIVFGWLGMLVLRGGLRGTVYPLSLVVSGMIVLLLSVILLNARAMLRAEMVRKEAEEARRRLNEIVEATPDFVGMVDLGNHALYVNDAGRKLIGASSAKLSQLTIPDFHPPDVAYRILHEAIPTAIKRGVWTGETQLKGRDGNLIPVSQVILAHKQRNGEVAYLSTVMRDITYRKRLELAQQFLLDVSRASSGSMDADTILRTLVNLVVPRHADYCAIHLLGSNGRIERTAIARGRRKQSNLDVLRVYPHGKRPPPQLAQVVRTGEAVIMRSVTDAELSRLTGGRHLQLMQKCKLRSLMILPIRGRERVLGVIYYVRTATNKPFEGHRVGLARELSSRIALSLDNAELLKRARDATRIRDEVLRVVAHDLRSPLNTISLTADFIQEKMRGPDPERWAGKLDIITRSVAHADRLIQDLLDVARMEAGTLTVEVLPTHVHGLISEVLEMHQPLAEDRGLELRTEIPANAGLVQADQGRIVQVFSNLIGNAIKFSPRGSYIVLSARQRNGSLTFSIRDRGPGIPEFEQAHLFDPFWQARKGNGGVGLGLPIARAIVQAHGGRIWCESKPARGSTFYFTLPIAQDRRQADRSAAD